MHNYKSAVWVLALISIALAPPGVHAQNDEPDLDTHLKLHQGFHPALLRR
jgi:hypothetical protein